MSSSFRKSLFGFNCDDVISYIESTHQSYTQKEAELKNEIEELSESLELVNSELNAARFANSRLERELKDYNDKYDEIERLSQNIGKLYLVAQANARAVMKNTAEAEEISRIETEKNLNALSEAHQSLDELKSKILTTSASFASQVEELLNSLDSARERITEQSEASREITERFNSLSAELVK